LALTLRGRLDEFHGIIEGPSNRYIERWKGSGKSIVGHFCSYVPVEVLTAAGILPVRLRGAGSRDSGEADVFLSSRTCTYVRHVLALALEDRYDFLDGEVSLNTCDHVRRAFDLWRHKTSVPFHGFLSVPRNARESLYPYFREEVENLKTAVEAHFDVAITDDGLEDALRLHNRVRRLLQTIDGFRAMERPRLTGTDMTAVAIASLVVPPDDFLELADGLIKALEDDGTDLPEPRARLMLTGAELDEPRFVAALESQGAIVVADLLCFGMRAHKGLAEEGTPDPMEAVCRRAFFMVPCARMIGNFPDRFDEIRRVISELGIDGVVFQRLKFCDPWGGEEHNLRRRVKQHQIPFLTLEREYGQVHAGQVRTRVQAFMEMMESRSRRGA